MLLQHVFGAGAGAVAALIAVIISLGTTNAFIAGVSRLGYSLGRDGWLPHSVSRVSVAGVPCGGIALVAAIAYAGIAIALARGWGTETLIVVPSTLVVTVYLLAAAAGVKLLNGMGRACAAVTVTVTLLVAPSAAAHVLIPFTVATLALLTRLLCRRRTHRASAESASSQRGDRASREGCCQDKGTACTFHPQSQTGKAIDAGTPSQL